MDLVGGQTTWDPSIFTNHLLAAQAGDGARHDGVVVPAQHAGDPAQPGDVQLPVPRPGTPSHK